MGTLPISLCVAFSSNWGAWGMWAYSFFSHFVCQSVCRSCIFVSTTFLKLLNRVLRDSVNFSVHKDMMCRFLKLNIDSINFFLFSDCMYISVLDTLKFYSLWKFFPPNLINNEKSDLWYDKLVVRNFYQKNRFLKTSWKLKIELYRRSSE